MEPTNLFIPVILATNRAGRQSEYVASVIADALEQSQDITTKLIDVRDIVLPQDNYGQSIKQDYPEFVNDMISADGVVFVMPEYNHSIPGHFKGVIDMLGEELNRKAAGIVGVSSGPWGGVRGIEALIPVLKYFGMYIASRDLQFPLVGSAFDDKGEFLKADEYEKRIEHFLEDVLWNARALKAARENE